MSTMTISNSSSISRAVTSEVAGVFSSIAAFFKHIGNAYERSEAARKEAYLAEAVDLYDLEYRMQSLDRESAQTAAWIKGF